MYYYDGQTHTFHEIIRIVSGLRKVEPPNSLVLSRQGLRVFPSSTPASLGFTEDQKEFLESWVSTTAFEGAQNEDQKKRVAQAEAMLSNESGLLSSLGITLNPSSLQAAVPEPIEEENPQESMYHIQIREKDGKVLKIRVPSEAPLSTLLTKLSELKKVPVKSLKLKLDGDAVGGDESLESLGVEDGDTLDLVIGGSAGVSAV